MISEEILSMKVGVIGTGKMGEYHVKTYLALQDHCELVGIFDRDEDRCREIAKKYQVKHFLSLDELLQTVDAVSIAVPTEYHYDIGLACIRNKTHLLIEKPITSTTWQADDLIEKAKAAGVKLQVGHIELFNPLIPILKNELENEKVIGISFLRLNPYDERMKDSDVVKDLMIHDLYILDELLQQKLVEFYALGNIIGHSTKHASVILESAQGVTVELIASFKSKRKIRTIQVFTEDALIEADLLNSTITVTRTATPLSPKIAVPLTKTLTIDKSIQPLDFQLIAFLDCITFDKTPAVSGEQGKRALELVNKISESIHPS
ncbi:Gfo/Idh/MocA family protein [Oceanobacillus alkalisoli]|uniref:Gfo/Idh/MocA family protein n=1 Tax=Oceanobacillus alkalisoli TaxID=2925113 RepID=UPI0021037561|nr:Gfo/Idh/MocA family oxidoreductase [Oceanobacillus alkalisoli]